jgi:alpha-beta hydrolase superfamily lysophospholipase
LAVEEERQPRELTSADGTRLRWCEWPHPAAEATLAVLPGLGEHSRRYDRFARAMAARGFGTLAVDLRGHGRSDGRRGHVTRWSDWTDDAVAFMQLAEARSKPPVIPVGHSFGGVVLLSTLLAGKVRPARFVVSSPALKLRAIVPQWKLVLGRLTSRVVPALALDNEVDPQALSRDAGVVEAYREDPLVHTRITSRTYTEWLDACAEIMARAHEIQTPFFASHGSDDRLVDPAGTEELFRRADVPGSELRIYPGRYHEPFNDVGSDEVFDDLAEWIRRSA